MAMTPDKPMRIYEDTSVFGGCFDAEFEEDSRKFFQLVKSGRVKVLISEIVLGEAQDAPRKVRDLIGSFSQNEISGVPLTGEVLGLRDAYIEAGVLTERSLEDATHVAAATAARATAIVSWNFKDIVRLDKIRMYNAVNLRMGYGLICILSPMEVGVDDQEGGE